MLKSVERKRLALFESVNLQLTPRELLDREGRPIYALDSGSDATPVVFVHGGGGDLSQWRDLAPIVLASGRRVVLIDRPGCGLSYPIAYGGFDYQQAAADFLLDVADALGANRLDLVANSMGGFFSLAFALAYPGRVGRLVLLGAPAGTEYNLPLALRLMGWKPLSKFVSKITRVRTTKDLRDLYGRLLVAHPERLDEAVLEVQVELCSTEKYEVGWRTLLEEFTRLGGHRYPIKNEVSAVQAPTTLIWGTRDEFAPPSAGHELVAQMNDARIVEVDGAGHLPWLDDIETCGRLVVAGLTERTATSAAA